MKKWEARLAEQRSTREYAALAREIDIAKKANLTMAEELVELGKTLAPRARPSRARSWSSPPSRASIGGQDGRDPPEAGRAPRAR